MTTKTSAKGSTGIEAVLAVILAAGLGIALIKGFAKTPQYVAMRQMIPVGQSMEEAQILYEISRAATHDCLNETKTSAAMITSAPAGTSSEKLISYLEAYCCDLNDLASSISLQEKQRDKLKAESEDRLCAWEKDVAQIQNLEKRTIEENKITKARMDVTTLLREADDELALIHASIRDGRDIELYVASLKHAGRMGTTAESVRTLRNELSLKADSFQTRTNDILASWK